MSSGSRVLNPSTVSFVPQLTFNNRSDYPDKRLFCTFSTADLALILPVPHNIHSLYRIWPSVPLSECWTSLHTRLFLGIKRLFQWTLPTIHAISPTKLEMNLVGA